MKPRCAWLPLALTLLVASGCDSDPEMLLVPEAGEDGFSDLDFNAPIISAALLLDQQAMISDGDATLASEGPALSEEEFWGQVGQIQSQRSTPMFRDGFASITGYHQYQGNKAKVETTAHLSYQSMYLGSQDAETEAASGTFAWGWRDVFTEAKVYHSHGCGLQIEGSSLHKAWWESFTAGQTWGLVSQTTQAPPQSSGACASYETTDPGQSGAPPPPAGWICHWRITYNVQTGAILDVEFLYCQALILI